MWMRAHWIVFYACEQDCPSTDLRNLKKRNELGETCFRRHCTRFWRVLPAQGSDYIVHGHRKLISPAWISMTLPTGQENTGERCIWHMESGVDHLDMSRCLIAVIGTTVMRSEHIYHSRPDRCARIHRGVSLQLADCLLHAYLQLTSRSTKWDEHQNSQTRFLYIGYSPCHLPQ